MVPNRVRLFLLAGAFLALAPGTTLLRGQSSPPAVPRDVPRTQTKDFSQDVPAHLDGHRRIHGHEGDESRFASRAKSQRGWHAAH